MLDKVKEHFVKHKTVYLTVSGVIVGTLVGAAATVYLSKNPTIVNKPIQILTWKSKQTIEVFVEALGDPGNVIQDVSTGIIYASQGQAARELGLSPARLSEHLHGELDHVKGHVFKLLGKAGVAPAA